MYLVYQGALYGINLFFFQMINAAYIWLHSKAVIYITILSKIIDLKFLEYYSILQPTVKERVFISLTDMTLSARLLFLVIHNKKYQNAFLQNRKGKNWSHSSITEANSGLEGEEERWKNINAEKMCKATEKHCPA